MTKMPYDFEYDLWKMESDGFDYEEGIPVHFCKLSHHVCGNFNDREYELVKVYAKVGLHRYNLLEDTNFQLHGIQSYNRRSRMCIASYYITLAACVPPSSLQQIFHVKIEETQMFGLDLRCAIARPRVTKKCVVGPFLRRHSGVELYPRYEDRLPDWPSEIAFNDRKRFYQVKESDLLSNEWISMYLNLVIRSYEKTRIDPLELEIVQVFIETNEAVEPPSERLNAKNATVYIMYKNLTEARIGEPVDWKAVVTRHFNEYHGELAIWGNFWSGERALRKSPSKNAMHVLRHRLGVNRVWQLSNPRCKQAYKNGGSSPRRRIA